MFNIAHIHEEYLRAGLLERDLNPDPLLQFERWFKEAQEAQIPLPNAMSLSTVSPEGQPSSRVVLLKDVDHGGFVFYTNYESHTGQHLLVNPRAALLFAWLPLERQIRIEGSLHRVSSEESEAYFNHRPLGSRHAAIASAQSTRVADRHALETAFNAVALEQKDQPKRPPHWGGYRLMPERLEFWQGRPSRLHDRLVYRLAHPTWLIERLAP